MTDIESMQPNRWYTARGLQRGRYPSPQGLLRLAVNAPDYIFTASVNSDYIRACAILPRTAAVKPLTQVPWSIVYWGRDHTEPYTMIIVSVADRSAWIDQARESGARAWLRAHNQSRTYEWTPPELGEPPAQTRPQRRNYNRAAILADIDTGLNYYRIAMKHGLTRATIQRIAERAGKYQ